MTKYSTANTMLGWVSRITQYRCPGINDSVACRTMPSSSAYPLTASSACSRSGAAAASLAFCMANSIPGREPVRVQNLSQMGCKCEPHIESRVWIVALSARKHLRVVLQHGLHRVSEPRGGGIDCKSRSVHHRIGAGIERLAADEDVAQLRHRRAVIGHRAQIALAAHAAHMLFGLGLQPDRVEG